MKSDNDLISASLGQLFLRGGDDGGFFQVGYIHPSVGDEDGHHFGCCQFGFVQGEVVPGAGQIDGEGGGAVGLEYECQIFHEIYFLSSKKWNRERSLEIRRPGGRLSFRFSGYIVFRKEKVSHGKYKFLNFYFKYKKEPGRNSSHSFPVLFAVCLFS